MSEEIVRKQRGQDKSRIMKVGRGRERSDCNITLLLHPKLRRRITYEGRKSEVDVKGNRRTGHVRNGDIIILEVFLQGTRVRRGARTKIVTMDMGVFRNHLSRTWRSDRMGLRGG